jgi:hypothetical protein
MMTTIHQRHEILDSLNALDASQAQKVLEYIKGLLYTTPDEATQKEATEILRRIRSRAWENEPNLHILRLSMDNVGQFERITVINMQMHAYL